MRHIPISRAAVSAANLGTNYSSLLPWCTRASWQQTPAKLIQILTDQLQPNSQKITWLLTTSEMLQKIYHKSWSTKSSAKKRMKKNTHKHTLSLSPSLTWLGAILRSTKKTQTKNLSLSLSLNFALQKLIARRNIKRKVLFFSKTTEYNSLNSLKRKMRKEIERSSWRKKKKLKPSENTHATAAKQRKFASRRETRSVLKKY